MNFRSVAQLSDQVLAWSKRLPRDIDIVVGVPRSGLLVANLLAVYRNIPLTDVDGLLDGRCLATGHWKKGSLNTAGSAEPAHNRFLDTPRKALIVDDSVGSGITMQAIRERIERADLPHTVQYGAVYLSPDQEEAVDVFVEILNFPRVFEWNVLQHTTLLKQTCFDIDGVLCHDPMGRENDDGDRYREFLRTAPLLLRPHGRVGWLVTSRLEKYRAETEAWLAEHQIQYDHLVMMDYPNQDTRMHMNTYGAHKAEVYRDSGALLFIESNVRQAVEIAALSRKEVLCIDTMQMISPNGLPVARPAQPLVDAHVPSLPRQLVTRYVPEDAKRVLRNLRSRIQS